MNRDERKKKIIELRNHDITGKFVILRPVRAEYASKIVNLRNRPQNMYWFNQSEPISVENQVKWLENYNNKDNDIYWCVLDKNKRFIGTIRLYGIDLDGDYCEEGSYVIDDKVADEAPYAVESKYLVIDVAFKELQIKSIINDNRADNKVMNNINKRLGFSKGEITKIRGVDYLHMTLTYEDYIKKRDVFLSVVEYWSER